jgi:hypothetical protein
MSVFLTRKDVQLTIIVVTFLVVTIPYFFKVPQIQDAATKITTSVAIINAFSITLAVWSQTKRSLDIIRERVHGWPYDIVLLLMLYGMLIIGTVLGEHSTPWQFVLYGVQMPMASVIFSIQAFYMASIMARGLRTRNYRILLLNIGIATIFLYQAPFTLTVLPVLDPISSVLSGSITKTFSRVFTIGVTFGSLALGARILSGREMGIMGYMEEE